MKSKNDIMTQKLVSQIMQKSSITADVWAKMTDEEIMQLVQFPTKVRANIVKLRAEKVLVNNLDAELKESHISAIIDSKLEEAGVKYDPETPVIKILSEQAEISAEEGITKLKYTSDELKACLAEAGDGTNWLILLKKAASTLDKDRIDNELLTELAKEQAQANKAKKK